MIAEQALSPRYKEASEEKGSAEYRPRPMLPSFQAEYRSILPCLCGGMPRPDRS